MNVKMQVFQSFLDILSRFLVSKPDIEMMFLKLSYPNLLCRHIQVDGTTRFHVPPSWYP